LTGAGKDEIPFYDFDPKLEPNARRRERYEVTVITEGSYQDAQEGAQTGRTLVRLLEPGEEGVRIPRGLDIPAFWEVIEDCVEKADAVVSKSA
jgi:uridine nucleosidase